MWIRYPLWLIDAFASETFQGNPAGVCLVDDFPNAIVMQKIAFEMHWSETAFLKKLSTNEFHIRWFAPEDEAPICGHATLAAAHFLFENNQNQGNCIHFQSCAGPLAVTKEVSNQGPWLIMDFPACPVVPCQDFQEIDNIKCVLEGHRPEKIFKDNLIYIAILKSEEEVLSCTPCLDFLQTLPCRALSITAQATSQEYDFVSRYFAPKVGIPEDPVCGSAHCRLTPLWAGIFNKKDLKARQISRRGGFLHLSYDKEQERVHIAGQAQTVLKGEFFSKMLVV